MKRPIMKSLMAFCAGVMTLCAMSNLFVSCNKYDDSALREQIGNLDKRLTALEELTARVDALYTLKFQLVTGTNELQYSFDNGANWTSTGVFLTEGSADISLVDEGDAVTITIGDQSFTIEKPEEIVFEIKAGKVYFESEGTQLVTIKSSGIEDITVISYPKGWFAEINDGGYVEVTAPNYADTQEGYDEDWNIIPAKYAAKGYVKVHACSADGKCMVGKLPVEVTDSPIVIKAFGGKYEISVVSSGWWPTTAYYGISTRESYAADAQVLIDAMLNMNWDVLDSWENYTADTVTGTFEEALGYAPKVGEEYVVWALNSDLETPSLDELVIAYYSPINVTVVEDEAQRTPYDNYITVEVQGAESYYVLAVPALYADSVDSFKEQMIDIEYGGLGKLLTGSYEGSLYQITDGTSAYVGTGSPGTTGYLLVLPVDGRPNDQYQVTDVLSFPFTTSSLELGGTVTSTAERVYEAMGYDPETYEQKMMPLDPYTEVGVEVAAPEGTWTYFYFGWIGEEEYQTTGGDAEAIVGLILSKTSTYEISPEESEWPNRIVNKQFEPEQSAHFVAFFLDENYKIGDLIELEVSTEALLKSEITLNPETNLVDGVLKNTTSFEVKFNPSANVSKYRYVKATTSNYNQYEGKTASEMSDLIYFTSSSSTAPTIKPEDLVDGKWTLSSGFSYNNSYYIAVLAYDEDGNPAEEAEIFEFSCVFQLDNVISDPAQFKSEPTIEFTVPANEDPAYGVAGFYMSGATGKYELNYTVKPVEGTEVITFMCTSALAADYGYDNSVPATTKASGLWGKNLIAGQNYYMYTNTAEKTVSIRTFNQYEESMGAAMEGYILVSWKDAEGNYYYKEVDLNPAFKYMWNVLTGGEAGTNPGTIVSPSVDENETPEMPAGPVEATVAEFLAAEVGDTWYQLTGTIENVSDASYGNFNLKDETGTVYVYGLTATQVDKNDKSFSSLNLKAGDEVTLIGKRAVYKETAQVGGPAYYVSHVDNTPDVEVADGNVAIALGTNAYKNESIVNGVPTYTYKIGTSKATGSFDVTIPAGTTKVKCNAVAWKGATGVTVEVKSGETVLATLPINANDGATANAPYTITTEGDFYELPFTAAVETVVTVTSASRVVIWNIIAE